MEEVKELSASYKRIHMQLSLSKKGDDCFVLITGGRVHLGAAGFSCGGIKTYSTDFPGHRDKDIVDIVLFRLSPQIKGNLIVAAGVHYDTITKEEIEKILEMSRQLADMAGALL